jgi:2-succinyl-6-hydroxy-2,4-cyclohexadiene-1-carboxylate synthase
MVLGPGRGVELYCERMGSGPELLVLHGFTGSGRTMRTLTQRLEGRFSLIVPDLVGHGRSDAPADVGAYTMTAVVAQLAELVEAGRPVGVVGYSMGARAGLALCADRPDLVSRALLIGVSPGIADASARTQRRASDEAVAERIESQGIAAFVDHWESLPIWSTQRGLSPEVRAGIRAERLANRPAGLVGSLRGMGTGAQPSLWGRLAAIDVPTCLVVGSEDAKFRTVAAQMAAAMPCAEVAVIDGAGHAAHVEQPEATAATVLHWFGERG